MHFQLAFDNENLSFLNSLTLTKFASKQKNYIKNIYKSSGEKEIHEKSTSIAIRASFLL